MGILFLFVYHLLKLVSELVHAQDNLCDKFPKTLQNARAMVVTQDVSFTEYVVCQKCSAIYNYDDCFTKLPNGTLISKKCQYVKYPNHPQVSRRKPCNASLLQKVKVGTQYQLKPHKVYCYNSLLTSIQRLVNRPGFLEKCEQWRSRSAVSEDTLLTDIYDGRVWHDFGKDFLKKPYSWCVTMNIDWFQPYTHVTDSLGAIYLVIQNLPRSERFKFENMVLVGLIPGPKEPKYTINSYIYPLVSELQKLWSGIRLSTAEGSKVIHVALYSL